MTDNLEINSAGAPRTTKIRWGGQRVTDYGAYIGIALFFWGLYHSLNALLIVPGIAIAAICLYLRDRTQFGAPGRPIFEEEYVRQPDGSYTNYKLRLKLTKFEIFLYVVGLFLIVYGVEKSMNWFLIVSGILLICVSQLCGNWWWFQGNDVGFSDSLSPAYEKLRTIGDEVRGEGYLVRRVENGIRYIEGAHSLTLRSGWAFVEKERIPGPDGGTAMGDKLHVTVRRAITWGRSWDAPHNKEKIPNDALLQISSKVGAALNSDTVFHVHT